MIINYNDEIAFSLSDVVTHQWGYAIQVTVYLHGEEDGGFCLVWPKRKGLPDHTARLRKVLNRLVTYMEDRERKHSVPPTEYKVRYAEVMELLIGRGYLKEGQRLKDLPDLTVIEPKEPLWRRVWNFLSRPLWG